MKLLKEVRESEEKGCRKRGENSRERELEKAKVEKVIRLKELEIKAKK